MNADHQFGRGPDYEGEFPRYVIMCYRGHRSVFGMACAFMRENNQVKIFKSREAAQAVCDSINKRSVSPNVHYAVEEYAR